MTTAVFPAALTGASARAQDRVVHAMANARAITQEHMAAAARACAAAAGARGGLMYYLIQGGAVTPLQVAGAMEREFGQRPLDLSGEAPDRRLTALLPAALARQLVAAVIGQEGSTVQVAMTDPYDTDALASLRGQIGMDVQPVVSDEHSLWHYIEQCYPQIDQIASHASRALQAVAEDAASTRTRRSSAVDQEVKEAAVPQYVRTVLEDAVQHRASDVHFEVYEDHARVRYRIDGHLLVARRDEDPRVAAAVAGHIKYLAELSSTSDRMPLDGALTMEIAGREIQFRVGTLPTVFGEKVVLRILDFSDVPQDIGKLGIAGRERDIVERTTRAKRGLILVTGPTNSGKSTTLAALVARLNRTDVNICTVEDPVERRIPGVQQVQVQPHDRNPQLDRSYATVLKAFLRQDPDIMMVGEMRDHETASIAIKAALTGHLVLSTLHTNDCASTITRLLDMGLDPFTMAGSLKAIVAQRLVRRVCSRCAEPYTPDPAELVLVGLAPNAMGSFRRGSGTTAAGTRCEACAGTGFRGREGLFEVMEITTGIRRAIAERRPELDLLQLARESGMRTLQEQAAARALGGTTTVAEAIDETYLLS